MLDVLERADRERITSIAERLAALPYDAGGWELEVYVGEEGPGVCDTWYGVALADGAAEPRFVAAQIDSRAVADFILNAPRDLAFLLELLQATQSPE